MQECCRRLLAAVSHSWGHPEGWSFRVDNEEELAHLKLTATYTRDGVRYGQRLCFSYGDLAQDNQEVIERQVLNMYREALRAIGRAT
jgi:hypothetical protein